MDPIINIYWVRHGYSCANYTRDNENSWHNPFAHTRVPDPKLHIVGREQAQQLAEIFNNEGINTDLICSSQLLRAIETAQTLLYNRLNTVTNNKIMILPQICEEGYTDDNIPYRFINNIIPKGTIQLDRLDYEKYYPSYEYFLRNVLVSLKDYLMSQNVRQEYNIIIVSHSHFLKTKGKFFDTK
jgi:broad specificity phosphatase PhoE